MKKMLNFFEKYKNEITKIYIDRYIDWPIICNYSAIVVGLLIQDLYPEQFEWYAASGTYHNSEAFHMWTLIYEKDTGEWAYIDLTSIQFYDKYLREIDVIPNNQIYLKSNFKILSYGEYAGNIVSGRESLPKVTFTKKDHKWNYYHPQELYQYNGFHRIPNGVSILENIDTPFGDLPCQKIDLQNLYEEFILDVSETYNEIKHKLGELNYDDKKGIRSNDYRSV